MTITSINPLAPIYSVVWLMILLALGYFTSAHIEAALNVAMGVDRSIMLTFQFLLTNPIGLVIDWLIGTVLIFRFTRTS